tara:strand:+ start:5074 stop:5610 length:537 start_codon:yes stop_codon:yes gene_type:complete
MTSYLSNIFNLNIREGCKSYDLYISSSLRRTKIISGLNILYDTDRKTYNKMIKSFQELAKNKKMIFLGISNDSAIFIKEGEIILNNANKYLDSYEKNARVSRIVLTDGIKEKSPPKCYPIRPGAIVGLDKSYYHKPNYDCPMQKAWEPHLAEYYIDTPDLWLTPLSNKGRTLGKSSSY